jgi:hypothetical protein
VSGPGDEFGPGVDPLVGAAVGGALDEHAAAAASAAAPATKERRGIARGSVTGASKQTQGASMWQLPPNPRFAQGDDIGRDE